MIHVLQTIGALGDHHGGPPRSITALCSALADDRTDVELFALEDREPNCRLILPKSERVRVHVLRGHQSSFRSARCFGASVVKAARPGGSIIHQNGLWLPMDHAVASAANRARIARIVSPRGMLSRWALDARRWKKRLGWLLYQRRDLATAAVIHATSEEEAKEIRESGLRQPIAVIPNGVDVPPLDSSGRNGNGRRRALFLSRIHPKKGVLELLEAWNRLRPPCWELIIAGPDDQGHQPQVEAAIKRLELSRYVTMSGPIADAAKWSLYAASDLFVLPTFSENFGIVIAEALASGLPVITTKGAPWSALTEHRCGWWIDVGVEPLETALREATALDAEQLRELGIRGRSLVINAFSWGKVATDMRAIYDWMLGRGECPATMRLT